MPSASVSPALRGMVFSARKADIVRHEDPQDNSAFEEQGNNLALVL